LGQRSRADSGGVDHRHARRVRGDEAGLDGDASRRQCVSAGPVALQKGTSGQVDQVYLDSNANWGSYTKMILDPVTIWAGRGSNMDKASPKEQKALADSFCTDLYNAAAKRCKMVTEPGPGTIAVENRAGRCLVREPLHEHAVDL
jgi:hypothetical protein